MRKLLFAMGIGLLLLPLWTEGASKAQPKTYRWMDDDGVVHYSDQVPPEELKHGRSRLSPGGRELETIEAPKSPEEMKKEKQLALLRSEQERILAEQRDRDLSLLRTYRSLDEMNMALQGQLQTLDSTIKITKANRERQRESLIGQQKRAADLERQGQPIQANLHTLMDAAMRQIQIYDEKLRGLDAERVAIIERFDKDKTRFKTITGQTKASADAGYGLRGADYLDSTGKFGFSISAVACAGVVCDEAWSLARAYISRYTQASLSVDTEKILKTQPPASESEMELVITRIGGKTEDILFLDVRCRPSTVGQVLCASPAVREVRSGFRAFIEDGLAINHNVP